MNVNVYFLTKYVSEDKQKLSSIKISYSHCGCHESTVLYTVKVINTVPTAVKACNKMLSLRHKDQIYWTM